MALSKIQTKRLGSILSIMFNEELPNDLYDKLINEGFVKLSDKGYILTEKGISEKNRLCTLAGLKIQYSSEKRATG